MKKLSLFLTLAATSVVLSSFAIALEPMLTLVDDKSILSANPFQLVQPVMAKERKLSLQAVPSGARALTITLPAHPGKRFEKLSFSFNPPGQKSKVAVVDFNLPQTQVFIGKPGALKQAIAVKDTWIDETGTLWLEFNAAVVPGTTLTVVFKPRTATGGSTYEYAVAAYPKTKYAVPVFAGDGSL